MEIREILFVMVMVGVPAAMAGRAYRVGYQQGRSDEQRRQERRRRYSSGRNSAERR